MIGGDKESPLFILNILKEKVEQLIAEGVEGKVEYKGKVEKIIYQLKGGLKSSMGYIGAKDINSLQKKDFELDEKNKNAILTDVGIDNIEKMSRTSGILKNNNFYDPENLTLVHHINQALKANFLFQKDHENPIQR